MIFSELNNAVSLVTRTTSWARHYRTSRQSVARRFVRLFAAHGIHRNQMLRVMGLDATLADVQTDEALLRILTDELIEKAARLFAVRREWLESASEQIYPTHDFYKQSDRFAEFLDSLLAGSYSGALRGMLLVAESRGFESNALLVLEEEFGSLGDKPLCRYHLCNNWNFDYWKSRAHLTACVAVAWAKKVYILGREVSMSDIRRYRDGLSFLDHREDSALPSLGRVWYPEDMALKPATFVKGLHGEERTQGLNLWLRLQSLGLMETTLRYEHVRSSFEEALQGEGYQSMPVRRRSSGVFDVIHE
jgi:hypothetical protein